MDEVALVQIRHRLKQLPKIDFDGVLLQRPVLLQDVRETPLTDVLHEDEMVLMISFTPEEFNYVPVSQQL